MPHEHIAQKTNTLAIVGFVLAFFLPFIGLILVIIALTQIKKTNQGGKGLAIAGLILSIIFLLFQIIILVAILGGSKAALDSAAHNNSSNSTSSAADKPAASQPAKPVEPPKPKQWGDGTYEVGRDIPAGVYVADGTNCYWQISRDPNGSDIIENNVGSGQQIVTLAAGTFFKVNRCPFTARN